jgi:hypothetical protein
MSPTSEVDYLILIIHAEVKKKVSEIITGDTVTKKLHMLE